MIAVALAFLPKYRREVGQDRLHLYLTGPMTSPAPRIVITFYSELCIAFDHERFNAIWPLASRSHDSASQQLFRHEHRWSMFTVTSHIGLGRRCHLL